MLPEIPIVSHFRTHVDIALKIYMTYMLLVENLQGNPRKFYMDIPANSTGKPSELLLHKIFILIFV